MPDMYSVLVNLQSQIDNGDVIKAILPDLETHGEIVGVRPSAYKVIVKTESGEQEFPARFLTGSEDKYVLLNPEHLVNLGDQLYNVFDHYYRNVSAEVESATSVEEIIELQNMLIKDNIPTRISGVKALCGKNVAMAYASYLAKGDVIVQYFSEEGCYYPLLIQEVNFPFIKCIFPYDSDSSDTFDTYNVPITQPSPAVFLTCQFQDEADPRAAMFETLDLAIGKESKWSGFTDPEVAKKVSEQLFAGKYDPVTE